MRQAFFLLFLFILIVLRPFCQLQKINLTAENVRSGVSAIYASQGKRRPFYVEIALYKNGKFRYEEDGHADNYKGICIGWWKKNNGIIILKGTADTVPVEIKYLNGVGDDRPRTKMMPIKNFFTNEVMTKAFVFINHDSIFCDLNHDSCFGNPGGKIDSIMVAFNNSDLKSKWIKVETGKYDALQIFVKTDFDPSQFERIDQMKFRVSGNLLIPVFAADK